MNMKTKDCSNFGEKFSQLFQVDPAAGFQAEFASVAGKPAALCDYLRRCWRLPE
jgi:hypothetical protein